MKTAIPARDQRASNSAGAPQPSRYTRQSRHLAQLAAIMNQSSRVRAQFKLAGEINPLQSPPSHTQEGNPAVVGLVQPATKNAKPVAQRWLDTKLISGRTRDHRTSALAKQAVAYNADRKGKTRTARINELHDLQVAAMKWLDAYEVPDQTVSEVALWVKDLMNDVQREHEELIEASITKKDDTPPIANFDKLLEKEQKIVKAVWSQLVAGSGNIRITETESFIHSTTKQPSSRPHEGFRIEALAQFARLLETSTGRDIVSQLNKDTKGQRLITIKPGFSKDSPDEGAHGSEFAASPGDLSGEDKLTPVDINAMFKGKPNAKRKREAYRAKFINVDLSSFVDPRLRAAEIYETRAQNPNASGIRVGGKYYKFGKGTAASVTMTRDVRDAVDHHTSRFVDKNLNEIPTPNFITLGHELGHALHMQTGVLLKNQTVNDELFPLVGPGAKEQDWSNLEEYGNISSVENAIRAEFGMKERYGHINQASVQKSRLEPIIQALYDLSDLQPQTSRAPVEAPLAEASQSLVKLEIPPIRTKLQSAATTFAGQMDTAFPGFTPGEKASAKAELTQFKLKVASTKPDRLLAALAHINQAKHLVTQANTRVQQQQQPPGQQQGGGGFWSWLGF